MGKRSQVFIFGDQSWPVESLAKSLPPEIDVEAWVDGRGWVLPEPDSSAIQSIKPRAQPVSRAVQAVQVCDLDSGGDAVAIVGFSRAEISQKVVESLRSRRGDIKILEVGARSHRPAFQRPKRSVAWGDLFSAGVETEIQLLSIQRRVQDLRDVLKDAPTIAILLQDDPDPDGLASALALRKVLHRNAQTAPIVSFGRITRPENLAMSRLLGIDVETVDEARLAAFDKTVMVDCQPSFFKGRSLKTNAILDHHPRVAVEVEGEPASPEFVEIREELGALSTLMVQFLRAAGEDISQRLATALLYGIKSDTLLLNREVDESDLEAFVHLYSKINTNTLRRIERPELPVAYLDVLRRGLRDLAVREGVVVLPLGKVTREEWIPQAADFALQVEGAQWAFGCGEFEGRVIVSGRNCGYVSHCGDLFKDLFDGLGCAGGHRTMAKAIVPRAAWKKRFGFSGGGSAEMSEGLSKLVLERLQEANKASLGSA